MATNNMADPVEVREEVVTLACWPTDVIRIDHQCADKDWHHRILPHTILLFIPGNPGCIGWYTKTLVELVRRLGPGYAGRGVSYAGHSANKALTQVEQQSLISERDVSIPWTVDGQIHHKCAFVDKILSEYRNKEKSLETTSPRFLFLSHSIGSHMVERLCVLRPDLLERTLGLVHLMPFIRMNAPSRNQQTLDWGAVHPATLIRIAKSSMYCLKALPLSVVNRMTKGIMQDVKDRELAIGLLRQPTYARNFFELGLEEIRDVPETEDVAALNLIGQKCPMAMLYAGNDQWAPHFHMTELMELQSKGIIPSNISFTHKKNLRHDYVSYKQMVPIVIDWCSESIQHMLSIQQTTGRRKRLQSKL